MRSAPVLPVRSRWLVPLTVVAFGAVAIVLVWLGYWSEVDKDRANARQSAQARLGSIARAMAEQAERSLTGVDITSLYLRDAWVHERQRFSEIVESLRPASIPGMMVNVMVNDADGWMSWSTYAPTPGPVNFADRDHFRLQRQNPADILHISRPVLGRISNRMMVPCSRKIVDDDGGFDGIMVVAIRPEDLLHLDEHLAMGPHGGVVLVGLDRVVRASASWTPSTVPDPGAEVPAERPYLADAEGGFEALGAIDRQPRLYAYRRLAHFPMVMVVSDTIEDIAATTRPHQRELAVFAVATSAAIAGFAIIIAAFIATQSRTNRALEQARRKSDLILASAGEGICGFDAVGGLTFINPAGRRMLGWDEASEQCRLRLAAQLRGLAPGGECKAELVRADGSGFPAEITVAALLDSQEAGAVMVFRDVTQAVETERALIEKSDALARSNAELEQFAYVASHDLREPLRMISSFLALLQKRLAGGLDQDCTEFLDFARDGAQRMDRLVLDLLEYSRIGRQQRPMAEVDLSKVLADVQRNLAAALAESDGSVAVTTPLPHVTGDEVEMTRLVQNLVGNALKYRSPERPPVVEIGADYTDNVWRIHVKDNGIGIAPEHFDRIFGVFQRLHSREQYDGTGIGLAVCKKIVEHHGGRIWVHSVPGEGSTFTFTLWG